MSGTAQTAQALGGPGGQVGGSPAPPGGAPGQNPAMQNPMVQQMQTAIQSMRAFVMAVKQHPGADQATIDQGAQMIRQGFMTVLQGAKGGQPPSQ